MTIQILEKAGAQTPRHPKAAAAEPARVFWPERLSPAAQDAARPWSAGDLAQLQGVVGNQAVGQLVAGAGPGPTLQASRTEAIARPPEPAPVPRPLQRLPRPAEPPLRLALAEAITHEPGGCDEAARTAFKLLRPFVDDPAQLGSVVLLWTRGAKDPDSHTAVRVQWDEGVFVVDTSMGQFPGGPDLFVGSEAAWRAQIADCIGQMSAVEFRSRATGLFYSDPNDMAFDLLEYFQKHHPEVGPQREPDAPPDGIAAEWEASAVPVLPARRGRRRWRRGR